MRGTIHDRKGKPITPIALPDDTTCSWLISSEGKASFTFALTDPKSRQFILNAGNLIRIEFDDLPFDWAGVIDGDEDWNEDGTITLSAWSGEHLLSFRRTPVDQEYTATSPGAMAKKLLDMANLPEDTLIRTGFIFMGGGTSQDTWDGKDIYEHMKSVMDNAGLEWNVLPAVDNNGFLYFTLNVWELRGVTTDMALQEGHNIRKRGKPLRVRTNEIVNDLLGLGDSSTDSRPKYYAPVNETSRALYGLRQGTEDFDGVTNQKTLEENTKESLIVKAKPKRTHTVDALNVGNTFKYLELGNIYPLRAYTYGWLADGSIGVEAQLRTVGLRYVVSSDVVELTGDEVTA